MSRSVGVKPIDCAQVWVFETSIQTLANTCPVSVSIRGVKTH